MLKRRYTAQDQSDLTPSQVEAVIKCGRIETAFKQCILELKRYGIKYVPMNRFCGNVDAL